MCVCRFGLWFSACEHFRLLIPCSHTSSRIGVFFFFSLQPFCSQWTALWSPLAASPTDFYTWQHCYLPCRSPSCQCSPGKWWTLALQGLQWKNSRTTLNESLAFQTFFKSVLVSFRSFVIWPSALREILSLGPQGKRFGWQRPSVPDFSRLCGRRSIKIHTIKRKKWKGFITDMQFVEEQMPPNKFLGKQTNKIVFSLRFAKIAPENSGLRCLQ